jgi:hypothetical protein
MAQRVGVLNLINLFNHKETSRVLRDCKLYNLKYSQLVLEHCSQESIIRAVIAFKESVQDLVVIYIGPDKMNINFCDDNLTFSDLCDQIDEAFGSECKFIVEDIPLKTPQFFHWDKSRGVVEILMRE